MGVAILPKFHFKYKKSMKKFLLIGALAVATIANAATTKVLQKTNVGSEAKKVNTEVLPFEWKDATTILKEHDALRAPKESTYDLADWYSMPGAFYFGIYEGLIQYTVAVMLVPYLDSVVYYNYYGATDWTINGQVAAEGVDSLVYSYGINREYHLPQTADHSFNPSIDWGTGYKDTTLSVKGTMYGNGAADSWIASAMSSKIIKGENMYMTLCAMNTDIMNEPDDDGNDFWRVGGVNGDTYYNGTGIHLTQGATKTADTLGIIVDNRGLMKIEQILWPIYNEGKADAVNKFIPDGAQLRVNIFPVKGNTIYLDDTIASAVMTNADYVSGGAGHEWLGTLHTKFYEEDMWGSLVQTPIWIDGDFYVQLTNFNETGCDFGIFSDFNCPTTGTTVYQYNGKYSFRGGKAAGGNYGQNLGVSFDAYFPTLISGEESNIMYVPNEGGYAYHSDPDTIGTVLYANVHPEDWEFEIEEDWLQVAEVDTAYYSQYRAGIIALQAEALPDGVTSRSALVNVIADGAVQTFVVYQGVGQGIENTKANAIFDNKNYDVLGREIKDQNFKGVVIRNGQKKLVK